MKNIQSIFYLATVIGSILSVTSCNNEDEIVTTGKQVPLEIQAGSVQTTRSIIEGSTLPEECQYGIFAMNDGSAINGGANVCVNYVKGVSNLSKNVYLPSDLDIPVYAYYPYNANYSNTKYLSEMPVDVTTQTDYLYGYSANSDFKLTYVKDTQPKATIYFKHAMARVTMRIKKATDNENTYKFPYINLLNVDKSAYFNILDGGTILDPTGTANLTTKPSDYALGSSDNEIVADFLVIPGNTEGKKIMLNMSSDISSFENGLSTAIPVTNWQAGQQYTYTVTIKDGSINISQATITPWSNNEQGGLVVNDGNYTGPEKQVEIGGTVGLAVDLGLSIRWANHNVGASAPEEYGGLYGWGDPTGKKTSTWSDDYPSKNPSADICATSYDIAYMQWGSDWRLPTLKEINELISNCTWTWTTKNEVNGYLVTGSNGKSIFLPAAGARDGEEVNSVNTNGFYWTGQLWQDFGGSMQWYGYRINFSSTWYEKSYYFRPYGYSVRPVARYK